MTDRAVNSFGTGRQTARMKKEEPRIGVTIDWRTEGHPLRS